MLKTLESGLNKVETWLVCAGLLILIFTVFAAAVLRFFGVDMSVSTDLAQLVFAWVSFIGADLAMRKDKHLAPQHAQPSAPYQFLPGEVDADDVRRRY